MANPEAQSDALAELARTVEKSKRLAVELAAVQERVVELTRQITANVESQKPKSSVVKPRTLKE